MATRKLSFTRLDQGKPLLNRGTLDQYRLVVVCVRGNVSVKETMSLILKEAIGPDGPSPTLVLGPTAPEDLSTDWTGRVGWITFVDGTSMAHPSTDVEIISPDNLLEINLFIEKASQGEGMATLPTVPKAALHELHLKPGQQPRSRGVAA